MTEKLKDKSTRRDFLKLASTTAPAALAATALSTTQVAADVAEPALDKMQDTEHTRAYYDSLSFLKTVCPACWLDIHQRRGQRLRDAQRL